MMDLFVRNDSVVRKIWGKADTVLFIFAGAAAEFSLNKAVDWLYFTGRLPANPLDRLFSTVSYSRNIIFAERSAALHTIDQITAIHKGVEQNRGAKIPDWAYRDVLFMLIDYSIRSFELLERKLTLAEKEEVFDVFYRMGARMELAGLPATYAQWLVMRRSHLQENLALSNFTHHLYSQYKKHLGFVRYQLLIQVQMLLVPGIINTRLGLGKASWIRFVLFVYKKCRAIKLISSVKNALLPAKYKTQIQQLDTVAQ